MKAIESNKGKLLVGMLLTGMLLILALMMPVSVAQAQDPAPVTVTANVKASDGSTGLDGAAIKYRVNGTSNWYTFGSTSGGGTATRSLAPGTYDFYATYQQSRSAEQTVDITSVATVNFQTSQAVVQAKASDNSMLDGVTIKYRPNGTTNWYTFGTTSGGQATRELFAGSFDYYAAYQQSRSADSLDNTVPGTASFQTSQAVVQAKASDNSALNGVTIKYRPNGTTNWYTFGTTSGGQATRELFAGSFDYYAAYQQSRSADSLGNTVPGTASFQTSQAVVQAKASDNSALDGVTIKYRPNGTTNWYTFGTTSGGQATRELFAGSFDYYAAYQQSRSADSLGNIVPDTASFQTSQAVVQAKASDNSALDGVTIKYRPNGTTNWYTFGTTSGGQATRELFAGSFDYYAAYQQSRSADSPGHTVPGTAAVFQTDQAVVQAKDCDSNPIDGVAVKYRSSGTSNWYTFGSTSGGQATRELFAGSFDYYATYQQSRSADDLNNVLPSSDHPVVFTLTKVQLQYGGSIKYRASGTSNWYTFSSPRYLFPGDFDLLLGGQYQTTLTVSGCSMEHSVLIIQLKDSSGAGVAGGTAHLGVGGWPVIGTTDSNGVLVYFHNGLLGNMRIRMDAPFYGGSQTSPTQDTTVNSVYDFQTSQVIIQLKDSAGNLTGGGVVRAGAGGWPVIGTTGDNSTGTLYHEHFSGVFKYRMSFNGTTEEQQHDVSTPFVFQTVQAVIQLKDHAGNLIDGGVVRFGIGGWPVIGTTGDGGTGQVTHEIFAGIYKFRMSYNYGTEEKQQDISTPVVFQTGLVKLHFGGSIKHGVGGWPAYSGPTEMLPIAHKFKFSGTGHPSIEKWFTPASGAVLEKSIVIVEFYDHAGGGIDGATVKYYHSGWKDLSGQTGDDGSGILFGAIDGALGNLKLRLYHGGGSQDKTQHQPTDSYYVFQTVLVTVNLKDHNGNLGTLPAEGVVKYYASGWKDFGTTSGGTVSKELLPLSYKFRMQYGGGSQDKTQNVGGDPTVNFQTTLVTVNLKDHLGNLGTLPAEGVVKYYASGWKDFGAASGGTVNKELLPLSYKFRMQYGGGSQDKTQNVRVNSIVDFQTTLVTVRLETGVGSGISGGVAKYYASGWKDFGVTDGSGDTTKELLPLSYKFRMQYGGATNDQVQNVGANPLVVFTAQNALPTVKLLDSLGNGIQGGVVKYYASGWKTFGTTGSDGTVSKDDLLPGTYKFRMQYGGGSMDIVQDISSNPIVTFQTALVTVNLKDHLGNLGSLLAEGTVKYYASGWKTFGTTSGGTVSKQLLPLSYKFRMQYGGGSQDKTQDVRVNSTVDFQTTLVTVNLKDHGGGLGSLPAEGTVKYYASGWKSFGTTSGGTVNKELLPLSYKFRMQYGGGSQDQTQNVASNPLVEFQTTEVAVTLKNCNDDGVAGGTVKYYASGWKTFGTTDSNGEAKKELLPLSYKFRIQYGGASNDKTQNVGADPTVEFTTTTVAFQFGDVIKYYASGWKTFSSPMEMLPGTYKFKFGSDYQYVDISGCSMTKSVVILKLKDHNGNPLAGGTARGGGGSLYGQWHVPGSTDANGVLFDFHDGLYTTMSYEIKYSNTAHKTQDITVNPVFEFQTNLLTLRLETAGGAPLDGGNPRYGNGSTYTTWWFPGGVTGSSAPGETAAEVFPGTYSFEMQYQGTAEAQVSVTIPDADTTLTWQTTNVTLQYSGQISYGGGNGDSRWFIKPSMELLPGTYKFHFRSCDRADLTIDSSAMTKSFVCAQLLDSGSGGLAGGDFEYRFGWGSHMSMGTTDASGTILYGIDGLQTNTKFRVSYAGGTTGDKQQNIASDSFVVFQTVPVTANLLDSVGTTDLSSSATFQYRYGWGAYQPLTGPTELLPVATKVKVDYMGASMEKEQNASANPDFVFQTVPVTAKLLASNGTTDLSSSATFQYRYGWGTHQPLTGPIELLPVATKVQVDYMGASVEKEQNASVNPNFVFQTVLVTAQLLDSVGTMDLSSSATFQYRYGWGTYQPLTGPIELLPVATKVKVDYMGTSVEKEQNVGSNPNFVFQTVSVTAQLLASDGTTDLSGSATFQYRYGWGTHQPLTGPIELLPVATKVMVTYAGTSLEKEQNVKTSPNFVFQTGSVSSTTCTRYRYGWGSYQPFSSPMELLSMSTKFADADGPDTSATPSAGGSISVICP